MLGFPPAHWCHCWPRLSCVPFIIVLATAAAASARQAWGQRPSIVTSVRHANTVKEIESLDWIGLFDPLEPYPRWWKEASDCASIPLPPLRPDSVQFYYVNAPDFAPLPTDKPNRMVAGATYAASEEIFLSVKRLRDEKSVKHEMLHQILYWWGEKDWDNDSRPEFRRCKLEVS